MWIKWAHLEIFTWTLSSQRPVHFPPPHVYVFSGNFSHGDVRLLIAHRFPSLAWLSTCIGRELCEASFFSIRAYCILAQTARNVLNQQNSYLSDVVLTRRYLRTDGLQGALLCTLPIPKTSLAVRISWEISSLVGARYALWKLLPPLARVRVKIRIPRLFDFLVLQFLNQRISDHHFSEVVRVYLKK